MAKIEERVLSMKFDNKQFKSAAADTLQSLEKLKNAVMSSSIGQSMKNAFNSDAFKGIRAGSEQAAGAIKTVTDAANSVDLTGIQNAAQQASKQFNVLQTVATGALASIGAKAASAGMNVLKSFALDPIMDGFKEYETKVDAIGRIKANTASKGTTMDEITTTLDDLNSYSDKTVYNFGQMTDSIAKFTTAGVDVKTAATSIKGLSNLAALSGASAAESANVNRQISQALGAGTVKLQDWMSVENAGMNGEAFKSVLFQVGKMNGTLKTGANTLADWEKSGKSFRETLQDGWLTTDVLNKSLKIMSDDMSEAEIAAMGFTAEQAKAMKLQSQNAFKAASDIKTFSQLQDTLKEAAGSSWVGVFEAMFGGLEESTKIFTGLSDVLTPLITNVPLAISGAFESWGKAGGRTDLIAAFSAIGKNVSTLLGPIGEAFRDVFGTAGNAGQQVAKVTAAFRKFTESVTVSSEAGRMLGSIFKVIFYVLKAGLTVVGGILRVFFSILGVAIRLFISVLNIVGKVFTTIHTAILKATHGVMEFFRGIRLAFDIISGKIKAKDVFGETVKSSLEGMSMLHKVAYSIVKAFDAVSDKVKAFGNSIKSVFSQLGRTFLTGDLFDGILPKTNPLVGFAAKAHETFAPLINLINNLRDAFGMLFKHDFNGYGTWMEDDKIVDNLLTINERVREFFNTFKNADPRRIWDAFSRGASDSAKAIKNLDFKTVLESFKELRHANPAAIFGKIKGINLKNVALDFKTSGIKQFKELSDSIGRSKGFQLASDGVRMLRDALANLNVGGMISPLGTMIAKLSKVDFSSAFSNIQSSIFKMGSEINNWLDETIADIDWGRIGLTLSMGLGGAIVGMLALPAGAGAGLTSLFKGMFSEDVDFGPMQAGLDGAKEGFSQSTTDIRKVLEKGLDKIKNPAESLKKFLITTGHAIATAGRVLMRSFKAIGDGIADISLDVDLSTLKDKILNIDLPALLTSIGLAFGGAGFVGMMKTLRDFTKGFADLGSGMGEGLKAAGKGFKAMGDAKKIEARAEALDAFGNAALKVAIAVAILVGALYVLSKIDTDGLVKGFAALAGIMIVLGAAMFALSKIDFGGGDFEWDPKKGKLANIMGGLQDMAKTATKGVMLAGLGVAIIGIGIAIGILADAMIKLSKLSWQEIAKGLTSVALLLGALVLAVRLIPEKDMIKAAIAMILIAESLDQLYLVIKKMSSLSWAELGKGLVGIGVSLAILIAATHFMDSEKMKKLGSSLLQLSVAFTVLAFAFKMFGQLKYAEMAKGFLVLAAALLFMVGVSKLVKPTILAQLGTQFLLLAAALIVLAFALHLISNLSWKTLVTGLVKTMLMIGALGLAMKLLPEKDIIKSSASLILLAAAIVILSLALRAMSSIDIGNVMTGVLAVMMLIPLMMILGSTMKTMAKAALSMVLVAAGIAALALALGLLVPVIFAFGNMSMETIGKGLLAIGGALLIMVAFGYLMAPVVVVLLTFAAALALIGVSALLFGIGAGLIGAGLAVIAASGLAAAAVIPVVAAALAAGIIAFAATLAAGAPILANSFYLIVTQLGIALLKVVQELGPMLIETVVVLLMALVDAVARLVPFIVDKFLEMLTGIMNAIAENAPAVIDAFINMINSLATTLEERGPEIQDSMSRLMKALIDIVIGIAGDMLQAAWDAMKSMLSGFLSGWGGDVFPWLTGVPGLIVNALGDLGSLLLDAGRNVMNGLKNGLSSGFESVKNFLSGAMGELKGIAQSVLQIKSPSRVFMKIGGYVSEGLAIGIEKNNNPAKSTEAMANGVINAAKSTFDTHSPSRVFEGIGKNVSNGLSEGISGASRNPIETARSMMDQVRDALFAGNFKTGAFNEDSGIISWALRVHNALAPLTNIASAIGKAFSEMAAKTNITNILAEAGQNAKYDYDKEMAERAKSYAETEKKLLDELDDSKKKEADANDKVTDSLDKQNKAQAQNNKLKKDTSITETETYGSGTSDVSTSDEVRKEQHDTERAERDREEQQKKSDEERKKHDETQAKLARLRALKDGYLAGEAIAEGTELGLANAESRVLTVAERYGDKISEILDRIKKRANEYMGIFEGMKQVGKTFKNVTDHLRDFKRAFGRLNTATTDKSFITNLGMMFDSIMGIGGELIGLIDVFDKIKPFLAPILAHFEKNLPAIMNLVRPFAPALAEALGGGLAAALPAIAGPALGIIGAIAGIGIFLYDMGKDQKIVGFLKTIVEQVVTFLKALPSKITNFIKTIVSGIKNTIKNIPNAVKWILGLLKDLATSLISAIPDIITGLVEGIIELIILVFETPGILIDAGVALITGIVDAIVASVGALTRVALWLIEEFLMIFTNPSESKLLAMIGKLITGIVKGIIGLVPKLFQAGVALVQGLINGILSFVNNIWDLVTAPFRMIINGVKRFFGIHSPSTVFFGFGTNLIQGLINGVLSFAGTIWNFIKSPFESVWNGITNLFSGIFTVGKNVVTNLVNGAKSVVTNSVNVVRDVGSKIWNGITGFFGNAYSTGQGLIANLRNGIGSFVGNIASQAKDVGSKIWNGITGFFGSLFGKGKSAVSDVGSGMLNSKNHAINIAQDIGTRITSTLSTAATTGSTGIGSNVIAGIGSGMRNAADSLWNGVKNVGSSIITGFKNFFGIKSPSRVMMGMGGYLTEGLGIGMEKNAELPVEAMRSISQMVLDEVDNLDPTIRPVIDLTDMKAGLNDLNKELSTVDISSEAAYRAASLMTAERNGLKTQHVTETQEKAGTVVNYTQNNYSPRELSAIDIYRQTQRQLDYVEVVGSKV